MIAAGILAVLFVSIAFYQYFVGPVNQSNKAVESDLDNEGFLEDKKAVLYFSTTADQDMDGKGKSFTVFLNQEGQANFFEMGGLELGGIGVNEDEVLMEDKENFYKVADGFEKIPRGKYQHTGDHIGYLKAKKGFYSLYNSGFDRQTGVYQSDLYWEEEGKFKKTVIPFFIEASVVDNDKLFTLSTSEDGQSYVISMAGIGSESSLETVTEIEKSENSTTFGQLQADEKYLYFIRQTGNLTEMVKVDKRSGENVISKAIEYQDNEETMYQQTPFSFKRSVFLQGKNLYFIDGFGDVYRIPTSGGESEKAFSFQKEDMQGSIEIFHKNNHLYLFTLNQNKSSAKILKYSLLKDEETGEWIIKNFPELNTFNKKVYLYDFIMLKEIKSN
ncbi:hypothetical protein [Terribacillus sp. JSM ZJ617]|uniref:hypothetical protein n=1 Tax=Terribacillus sp. JSM ZJ617 TaxID=3342119 RepID=UPI0035A998BD